MTFLSIFLNAQVMYSVCVIVSKIPHLVFGTLEVTSQVHADLVFVAQQSFKHLVGRHSDSSKRWSLEFASELEDLLVQLFDFLVVFQNFSLNIISEIVSFVNLGMDLSAKLFQFLVTHTGHVWEWGDSLGEDFLLFGGFSFGLPH